MPNLCGVQQRMIAEALEELKNKKGQESQIKRSPDEVKVSDSVTVSVHDAGHCYIYW